MGKGRSGKAKQEAVILVSEEKVMEVEGGTGCSLGADRLLFQLLPMKTQQPWRKAQCGSDGERGGDK